MAFKDSANTACLMCEHVFGEHLPILYVSHEQDDGAWIFLCNVREHDIGNNATGVHRNENGSGPAVA